MMVVVAPVAVVMEEAVAAVAEARAVVVSSVVAVAPEVRRRAGRVDTLGKGAVAREGVERAAEVMEAAERVVEARVER